MTKRPFCLVLDERVHPLDQCGVEQGRPQEHACATRSDTQVQESSCWRAEEPSRAGLAGHVSSTAWGQEQHILQSHSSKGLLSGESQLEKCMTIQDVTVPISVIKAYPPMSVKLTSCPPGLLYRQPERAWQGLKEPGECAGDVSPYSKATHHTAGRAEVLPEEGSPGSSAEQLIGALHGPAWHGGPQDEPNLVSRSAHPTVHPSLVFPTSRV